MIEEGGNIIMSENKKTKTMAIAIIAVVLIAAVVIGVLVSGKGSPSGEASQGGETAQEPKTLTVI